MAKEVVVTVPKRTDFEWSDYVLTLFHEDELEKGNPKVDGLRRVVELLLGPITISESTIEKAPTEHDKTATVSHKIFVFDKISGMERRYSDVADCSPDNTDNFFSIFPAAIAGTRAESRCLRKLLGLRNVVAAEELKNVAGSGAPISMEQGNTIKFLCDRNNIELAKFINSGSKKYTSLDGVSFDTATKMIQRLNVYQRDQSKIPEELKMERNN